MAKLFIKYKFSVAGEIQFSRAIELLGQDLDDFKPVFEKISVSFYKHMKLVFAQEGAIGSRAVWAPLSSRYKLWKDKKYPGKKILERTGALKASLTKKGAAFGVLEIDKMEMAIGTSISYAMSHQLGETRSNSVLPQRKIIEITGDVKTEWTKFFHIYIYEKLTSTWSNENIEEKE